MIWPVWAWRERALAHQQAMGAREIAGLGPVAVSGHTWPAVEPGAERAVYDRLYADYLAGN